MPENQHAISNKILIIDDEEVLRDIVRDLLEDEGYHVIDACDGEVALEVVKDNPDIDIVIVDLNMPKKNGAEFIAELREAHLLLGVPIVVVSAVVTKDTRKFVEKHNVTDFIHKPYEEDILLEKLSDFLKNAA